MKHLFVTYEIAVQLLTKNFDEPCLAYYRDKKIAGVNKFDRKDYEFHILYNKEITNTIHEIILAPLYQQVIDWFRDKHNIFIMPTILTLDTKKPTYKVGIFGMKDGDEPATAKWNTSYYNALDNAIEEALKLI